MKINAQGAVFAVVCCYLLIVVLSERTDQPSTASAKVYSASRVSPAGRNEAPEAKEAKSNLLGAWSGQQLAIPANLLLVERPQGGFELISKVKDGGLLSLTLKEVPSNRGRRFDQVSSSDGVQKGLSTESAEFAFSHLMDLVGFRELDTFHDYGFAVGGPHGEWLKEIDERLEGDCSLREISLLTNIRNLGMDLMRSKGKADDKAERLIETILIGLQGDSTFEGDEWFILTPANRLQIWSKDSLVADLDPVSG